MIVDVLSVDVDESGARVAIAVGDKPGGGTVLTVPVSPDRVAYAFRKQRQAVSVVGDFDGLAVSEARAV